MSYTHLHLPNVDVLQKILLENPSKIEYYAKYDGLVGTNESVEFLNTKIDEYYKSKKN